MFQRIEDYLSYSYSDELNNKYILERLNEGLFEVYLPTKLQMRPADKKLTDWDDEREKVFTGVYNFAFNYVDLSIGLKFLEYHYQKYVDKHGIGLDFLIFIQENFPILKASREVRRPVILEWVEKQMKEMNRQPLKEESELVSTKERIHWNGSPALFGYIILELVDKGYIEPPKYGGEWSYAKLAKLCFQYFEIKNKKGELTTIGNLTKEMQDLEKNTLSPFKREKIKIPDLSELA